MLPSHKIKVAVALEIAFLMTQKFTKAHIQGNGKALDIVTDTLMAIEFNNWTRQDLAVEVILAEILEVRAVGGLAGLVIRRLGTNSTYLQKI